MFVDGGSPVDVNPGPDKEVLKTLLSGVFGDHHSWVAITREH